MERLSDLTVYHDEHVIIRKIEYDTKTECIGYGLYLYGKWIEINPRNIIINDNDVNLKRDYRKRIEKLEKEIEEAKNDNKRHDKT